MFFVVNFRYKTIFRNKTKIFCLFLAKGRKGERESSNKEIGLEANESKQIKPQNLTSSRILFATKTGLYKN